MTPAEIAARRDLLEATEKFAATLRAELAAEGAQVQTAPVEELRIKDVAADYGVSPKTARRWAHQWGYQLGGVWFIRRDAIRRARP